MKKLANVPIRLQSQKRIEVAMKNRRVSRLTFANKPSLTAAGSVAIGLVIAFGVIDSPSIRAQSPPPKFEVASVKPNLSTGPGSTRFDPAGVNIRWARLLDLIATAYRIPYSRISTTDPRTGDLFTTRYDILAKAAADVSKEQLLEMLQTLLADRFKLTLHRETKVQPVYKLVVGKDGPKLAEPKSTQIPDQNCNLPQCIAFNNTEMWIFAATLTGRMGRPVLDMTGLKGTYDFSLRLDILEGLTNGDSDHKPKVADWSTSSIFTDVEKQLGLKLEADRAPVDTLVIDHAEKPSEN